MKEILTNFNLPSVSESPRSDELSNQLLGTERDIDPEAVLDSVMKTIG